MTIQGILRKTNLEFTVVRHLFLTILDSPCHVCAGQSSRPGMQQGNQERNSLVVDVGMRP